MAKRKLYSESAEEISACSPEMDSNNCDVCGEEIDPVDMIRFENKFLRERLRQIASICKIAKFCLANESGYDFQPDYTFEGVFGAIEHHAEIFGD